MSQQLTIFFVVLLVTKNNLKLQTVTETNLVDCRIIYINAAENSKNFTGQ